MLQKMFMFLDLVNCTKQIPKIVSCPIISPFIKNRDFKKVKKNLDLCIISCLNTANFLVCPIKLSQAIRKNSRRARSRVSE